VRFVKWQLPDDVVFVDEIPKTSVGKFSEKDIRKQYGAYYLTRNIHQVAPGQPPTLATRPILHGLYSYGCAGRAILHQICGSDPARLLSSARL